MEVLKIEVLNPKALKLIKGMEELKLIKVSHSPDTTLKSYLKKMRKNNNDVPSPEVISEIVEEVRAERYAKK